MFNLRGFLALFRPAAGRPYELALRALEQGRYAEALARFDSLLADPGLAPLRRAAAANKRGVTLVRMQRREDARAAFESALLAVPRYAPALVNLGNLLLETGDVEQAISHYEDAVRSDEAYALAHHNLAVAYKRLGRMDDSVRELKRAYRLEGRTPKRQSTQWR